MLCSFFVVKVFCLKKNICSKMQHWRCQIFVAVSWSYYFHSPGFQCVWTFSLSLLFCLWYLAFFSPCLRLKKPSAQQSSTNYLATLLGSDALAANFGRPFTTASKLALSKQLMNINIVFVIGAGPLLNSKSSIRDKIKHTIISDWQGPNLEDFFFLLQQFKEKDTTSS